MWVVYILLCEDSSLYTGITNNIEKRLLAHKSGKGGSYTRSHKIKRILYQEQFETKSDALKREFKIKSWSREEKIKKLGLTLSPIV